MTDKMIVLGEKAYLIPRLPIKALRVIVPAITGLNIHFKNILTTGHVTQQQMDDMLAICHAAVAVKTPELRDKDKFMELIFEMDQLTAAIPVIAEQAGLVKKDRKEGETGEAPAAS